MNLIIGSSRPFLEIKTLAAIPNIMQPVTIVKKGGFRLGLRDFLLVTVENVKDDEPNDLKYRDIDDSVYVGLVEEAIFEDEALD